MLNCAKNEPVPVILAQTGGGTGFELEVSRDQRTYGCNCAYGKFLPRSLLKHEHFAANPFCLRLLLTNDNKVF
jgi:hypothetical protein